MNGKVSDNGLKNNVFSKCLSQLFNNASEALTACTWVFMNLNTPEIGETKSQYPVSAKITKYCGNMLLHVCG